MTARISQNFECNNITEVKAATTALTRAYEVPLSLIDGGVEKDVPNFKGVYNPTMGKMVAAVVPHYNIVTHKDYFDSFAEAMDRLNIEYKMSITEFNNRGFADIEFKGRNLKFDKLNEEFTTGIRLVNSYDKSLGLVCAPRFTRLACTNGMILTRSEKTVSIKHSSKMLTEIEAFVERKLSEIINKDVELQSWISVSIKDTTEWNIVCRILEKMFNQPKHREEILKRLGISMIVVKKKGSKATSFSYVLEDAQKKKQLNRWDVYNAITNYLTHGEHMTPHIENLFQRKAEKLLLTPFEKLPMIEVTI